MSSSREPGVSQIPLHCFDCYHGRYELLVRDEPYKLADGTTVMVPRVNYLRCMDCGEEILTNESNDYLLGIGPPGIQWDETAEDP
jgi:YgiT-type zinc finger domain-containing protein